MNVLGARIRINPTCKTDLPFLRSLWNDGDVMRYLGYPHGMRLTDASMEQWWTMTSPTMPQSTTANPHCTILRQDGRPIGELTYSLDADHRARIDLKLAPEYWGQGYATETLLLVLRELFSTTLVKRVIVEPSPDNRRAVHLMERCGFRPAPTENHPHRWECTRVDFANRDRGAIPSFA